jgi:hypothetical protein
MDVETHKVQEEKCIVGQGRNTGNMGSVAALCVAFEADA